MSAAPGESVGVKSSSQKASLYRPLVTENENIRLLNILPEDGSPYIHCHLGMYSLKDVSPPYERFLSQNSYSGLREPDAIEKWTESHLSPALAKLEPVKRVNSTKPSPKLYRFAWGDFAALSYVWGDQSNKRKIFVNKQEFMITVSLEQVLREFRGEGEFSGRFKLWVDALSINQGDLKERADQVRRMPRIYGVAWTVIADIGRATSRSRLALRLIQDIVTFKEASCERELEARLQEDSAFLGTMGWLGLHELMDRDYWYRLWIIQEVLMGGRRVWIRCGELSLHWVTFCTGIAVLQEHLWLVKDNCLKEDMKEAMVDGSVAWSTTSLHLVYNDLSGSVISGLPKEDIRLEFERLLDLAHDSECLDPRDKVYGLIGLMPTSVSNLLQPDYSLSPAEVYVRATKAFIEAFGSLEPLREANPWGPADCPSWAVDWLWSSRQGRFSRFDAPIWGPKYLFPTRPNSAEYIPYNASKRSKPHVRFLEKGLLECQGFVVDIISGLSARGKGYFSWDPDTVVSPEKFQSVYGGHDATAEALSRMLIGERDVYGQKVTGDGHAAILQLPSTFLLAKPQFISRGWTWLAGQHGYYFRWERFRSFNKSFRLGETLLDDFLCDDIDPKTSEYDVNQVYSSFGRSSQRRRFMTTQGGYLGWAPDNVYGGPNEQTQVGDLIVIIFGCTAPLVIRPCGTYHQVLGEAYVQGMMDGEAMDGLDRNFYQSSTFTFC